MEKRSLGKSGLVVSALSFGAMTFNDDAKSIFGEIGVVAGKDAQRLTDICLDNGVTTFDTAGSYGNGSSEEILGECLAAKRKDAVIATKVFYPVGAGDHDQGLSRRHIIDACEASLRRLRTDWIDLFQVHNFDYRVPLEESMRALDDLVRAGKVRYIGCSNHTGWQLAKAAGLSKQLNLHHYISQQIQYSLLVREAEWELLPCADDIGMGTMVWSPLAQGYLSGKFHGAAAQGTRIGERGNLSRWDTNQGRAVVDCLFEIAAELGDSVSAAQVALAWLLGRHGISSVLVGARAEDQLLDNLAAAKLRLSDDQVARLSKASDVPVPYPETSQRLFRETPTSRSYPRNSA